MSIKGLTDRGMSFPEIGTIRKGAPKPDNGKGPGRDLKYFRIEFDEREVDARNKFLGIYGTEPTEINVVLMFNDIERMWDAWYEAYTAGRMVARADGEKYIYLVNDKGEVKVKNGLPYTPFNENDIVGTWKNSNTNKQEKVTCKPVGRLKVVIPDLQRMVYMTVLTGSIHDIINISNQLEALKHINDGQIAGIPLVLRRRPKKISTPRPDGTRARYEKWMLSIEADPEWVKRKIVQVKHLALPGNGLVLLPEGEQEQDPIIEHQDDDEWEPPNDYEVQEGEYEEQEPEPIEKVVTVSRELAAALIIKIGERTLEDYSVDELQDILDNKKAAKSLKDAAQIVLDSKIPQPGLI